MVLKLAWGLGDGWGVLLGHGENRACSTGSCGLEVLGSHLPLPPDVSPAEKPGLTEKRGGLGVPSRDRNFGAPGQDVPGVSLHPLSGDSPDREPGEFLEHPHPTPERPPSVLRLPLLAPGHQNY